MALMDLRAVRRRTIRSEPNPLDRSTIVNIFPKDINETKPTLQPSTYIIKSGTYENPSLLVVGSACWWREIDEDQPLLEIPVSSVQVADSVVKDYCNGMLGCDMSTRMPGLFFVPGEVNLDKLRKEYKGLLDKAAEKQKAWYFQLVRLADSLWARANGNPLAIADDMRLAARELKMDKPWIKDFQLMSFVACVACGNMRNPMFPICPHCKAIVDADRAKELKLTFAQ